MSDAQWSAVDRYITETLVQPDAALTAALEASTAAGLPPIAVAGPQGKLLHLDGAIIDEASTDPSVRGVRRLNEMLRTNPRVSATTIQTVGSKGYDGFTIALVLDDASVRA
jgi:hypothetical protein